MKRLTLTIPEPCQENWNEMTPAEKGRFCGSCQKDVIDFTRMNDAQLASFFKKPSTGSMCGRFMADQLDRDIDMPRKRIPWLKYFFQVAIPAFLLSSKATAQGKVMTDKKDTTLNKQLEGFVSGLTITRAIPTIFSIEGQVVNESGEPVPFASIVLRNDGRGLTADSSGRFRLTEVLIRSGASVEFSSAGFRPKELYLSSANAGELVVQLNALPALTNVTVLSGANMLGGLIYRVTSKRDWGIKKRSSSSENVLQVYPNPLTVGRSLNIDTKKLKAGVYSFQLMDVSGKQVAVSTLSINKGTTLLAVPLPVLTPGNYFAKLVSTNSVKSYSAKIVIAP